MGVVGSGTESWGRRAAPLGQALARLGVHLVTGGGAGVMARVARAFTAVEARNGLSLGILPAAPGPDPTGAPPGYPNPWVELPVRTHLPARGARGGDPDSRNHLVVLTAGVVVALPGGAGTRSEVELAVAYRRPVTAWLEDPAEMPGLPDQAVVSPSLEAVMAFVSRSLGAIDGETG